MEKVKSGYGLARIIPVIILLLGSYSAQACDLFGVVRKNQTINFGESAEFRVDNVAKVPVTWKLYDASGVVSRQGEGDETGMIQFSAPGNFYVVFNAMVSPHTVRPGGEDHKDVDTAYIVVNAVKMTYKLDQVTLSNKIQKGVSAYGTVLNVPVVVETYDHQPITYKPVSITTAGVGTEIMAIPLQQSTVTLAEGTHVFTYTLHGTATQTAYIMFDFTDVNGGVQTYYTAVK